MKTKAMTQATNQRQFSQHQLIREHPATPEMYVLCTVCQFCQGTASGTSAKATVKPQRNLRFRGKPWGGGKPCPVGGFGW